MARNSLYTDLSGKRLGRWTVLTRVKDRRHASYWSCVCKCGTKREVRGAMLRRGIALSCGCIAREKHTKHLMTYSREWKSWVGMKERCYCKTNKRYPLYGARGITVCERWRESFLNFFKDMGKVPPRYSIERVDNNGNYELANCIWATQQTQNRNRRSNVHLTLNGETRILSDWPKILGISKRTMEYRRNKGLTDEQILSKSRVVICKQGRPPNKDKS